MGYQEFFVATLILMRAEHYFPPLIVKHCYLAYYNKRLYEAVPIFDYLLPYFLSPSPSLSSFNYVNGLVFEFILKS